ncbi:RNA 2',3'-cyclic phosphodiesterase [Billgrantia sp. Q4P2]|uniref:RNA 2',3'-cyclic phosphodiesterase n=1 Tax=Billgrantia sp. Q4P2 TaxID=3463857 RepID=UPI004055F8CF
MRLFIALTPPPELRERLGELADVAHARCGGRRMPEESLHLTLAFLGNVEEVRAAELAAWVQDLVVTPGEWQMQRWGSFQRPGIVWIGGRGRDPALERLQGRLWSALEPCGLGTRPARFIPHVTLLRRAVTLDLEGLPSIDLAWSYNQLELIESIIDERGARYRTLAVSQG